MKKVLLFAILSTSIIFTNCKKKKDDPAPANNSGTNGSTTSQFGNTSAISSDGTVTNLSTKGYTSGSGFSIIGTATSGSYQSMTAAFYTGKPTSNYSVDLSKSSTDFQLAYVTPNTSLRATSGTANVMVTDTTIVVNFTDAVFTDPSGFNGGTYKYSGQLILSTKTTGGTTGGGTTTAATTSGSLSVNGGTATSLTVTGMSTGSAFSLMGYTSSYNYINAAFYNGKPTASSVEDLTNSTKISLSYTTLSSGGKTYSPTSGTATITVNGTAITTTFTNVVFSDGSTTNPSTVTLSGSLYTSK